MLQSITWYQFFSALGIAAGLYYVGALAYFYLEEIKALFKGELAIAGLPGFNNHSRLFSESEAEKQTESVQARPSENDDVLIGKVSDLVDEIKSVTAQHDSLSLEKAKSIFSVLLKKYPSLIGTHYQETISLFIADTLTDKGEYEIDRREVQQWWTVNESKQTGVFSKEKNTALAVAIFFCMVLQVFQASAQDGNAGINEATMRVRSFFATGVNLTYAIGAIIGLIGAVKVYQKWNSGDPDTGKVAASWFGSCVFLVITATVLRSFFGV